MEHQLIKDLRVIGVMVNLTETGGVDYHVFKALPSTAVIINPLSFWNRKGRSNISSELYD